MRIAGEIQRNALNAFAAALDSRPCAVVPLAGQ